MSERIFVVDDDRTIRHVLVQALREAGFDVQGFDGVSPVLAALERGERPGLLFTDVRMPQTDGLEFLEILRMRCPDLPVVVMSAYTDVATSAAAFRGGACDYLPKPFDLDAPVRLAGELIHRSAIAVAPPPGPVASGPPALLGDSPPMRELFRAIGRYAQLPLAVLITGETGTGKELVARALHAESPRAARPFVGINTAAIPAELLESELFGHEAGAFTGANRRHVGKFEQADGGTLFLDEIGDMPAALQTRLLRVLAEGEFFRVGGRELIRVDVRIIAATHQDLRQRVVEGRFREDLLHRIDLLRLELAPLRKRPEDLPRLAQTFIDQAVRELGCGPRRLSGTAQDRLLRHAWPGNVRELRNLCYRLVALSSSERIPLQAVEVGLRTQGAAGATDGDSAWRAALEARVRSLLAAGGEEIAAPLRQAFEESLLATALEHHAGHRQRAAVQLGIGRNTLARRIGPGRRGRKPSP